MADGRLLAWSEGRPDQDNDEGYGGAVAASAHDVRMGLPLDARQLIDLKCCNVQRGLTPSQAAGGRAVLRAMLWCAVAGAAAAVLALRQPAAAGRRGARLALVLVALAFIAATYCARICLLCLFVATAERSLLGFLVTLTVVLCTVYDDILSFMSLLRGFGPEMEE